MSMMHFEPFRSFRDLDRLTNQLLSGARTPMEMPMDVWREGQSYRVALDVPGVDPESIEVNVERNTLTVSAQRQAWYGGGEGGAGEGAGAGEPAQILVAERPMGVFSRQLVLGEGLDTEQVSADYTNGVLHLTIPLAPTAQPRRIQVGRAGGAGGGRVIQGESAQSGS